MNTFDRHLLREWLQILALVLAATCGLLVVQVLYDDFRELRDLGARGLVLWEYVGVKVPGFLSAVLPIALLVSLLYALGKLHRGNELTAMRAAGVGFFRLTAPIWVVGVLCCGLSWWLNTNLVPWSVERSRAIREDLEFARDAKRGEQSDKIGAVYSVAFDNSAAGRMWFFNRYSRANNRGYGVAVFELDARRREVARVVATQAWFDPLAGSWVFKDARRMTFDVETGQQESSVPHAILRAESYHEDPELMLLLTRKRSDLLLEELRALIAYLKAEKSPQLVAYTVRYYSLLADTLGPLIVIAIAIPFAIAGVRVNPAVGVSKSIGLFFLYYVLNSLGTSLANHGWVDARFAAWLPHATMAALALWFFARLR